MLSLVRAASSEAVTLSSATNATSYNLGNVNMPSAGLAVVFHYADMSADFVISTCSIGGTNANIVRASQGCGMSYTVVSAGNNNITITFPSQAIRCAVGVWLITSYLSTTSTDHNDNFNAATASHGMALTIKSGGVAIWGNKHGNTNVTSWANATEAFDGSVESSVVVTGASYAAPSGTTRTATASWSGSAQSSIAGISFR